MKGIIKLQKVLIWKVFFIWNSTLFCFLTHSFFFSSCCLIGFHIGQVQLIFALPDYLHGNDLPKYQAYIEWFNPFHAPIADFKLYSVTCSHCNNSHITKIMPLASIISSCYLMPKFGTTYHPARWSRANVLKECKYFTLNKYISLYLFYHLENVKS